jgi:hypothetical protein
MQARGERAKGGGYRRENDSATVAGSSEKTTEQLAKKAGVSLGCPIGRWSWLRSARGAVRGNRNPISRPA